MNIAALLAIFQQLLAVIPSGTALWLRYKGDYDHLQSLYADGPDRQVTDAEWAALDARASAAESAIDTAAANRT